MLTNSERMDGILGLTEQAWGDWLGTGPPMTSQMQQASLGSLYTLLLAIAGALLLAAAICVALVWRRPRARRRQWVWRRRPTVAGGVLRTATIAAALAAAGAWALLPLRDELASVTPVRVMLATGALALLCVVVDDGAHAARRAVRATAGRYGWPGLATRGRAGGRYGGPMIAGGVGADRWDECLRASGLDEVMALGEGSATLAVAVLDGPVAVDHAGL